MNIYVIGGTDAGGWYIGSDGKIHKIPGWNPEAMVELGHALNILREAGQLKTPRLAEAAIKSVNAFVQKELSTQLKEGGVVLVR
ncbi:MAG: hypothetical protein AABO41_18700 [Acidobacteriota bacterium]